MCTSLYKLPFILPSQFGNWNGVSRWAGGGGEGVVWRGLCRVKRCGTAWRRPGDYRASEGPVRYLPGLRSTAQRLGLPHETCRRRDREMNNRAVLMGAATSCPCGPMRCLLISFISIWSEANIFSVAQNNAASLRTSIRTEWWRSYRIEMKSRSVKYIHRSNTENA